jgi:endo-1,4-beta-xylanase
VNDNATPRQTVWSSIGYPSYIDIAFRAAHAADPDARLFYNDYLIEDITPKSTAVYNLVKGMKARGVPIHGVGMQAHMNTDNAVPTVTRLRENIRRFGALGLKVRYTELDVRTRTSDGTSTTEIERKRAFYRNLVRACRLESSTCIGVTFWGIDPEESWIPTTFPGYAARLLYNASYGKTEVYDIVAAELR